MKRLLAVTGTRADWSKLQPLLASVWDDTEVHCAVVGQHLDPAYGSTHLEVERSFADAPFRCWRMPNGVGRQPHTETVERTLPFLRHVAAFVQPDLTLVHGDRSEALAAGVLALDGYRLAHVEGGEVSGNVDERIRHAVSKLADDHFVSNDDAARRLYSMGEDPERVHVIGSPEIDTLRSDTLPSMREVRERYEIPDGPLALMCLHPERRLVDPVLSRVRECMTSTAIRHKVCWVVFEPNSDPGHEQILRAWDGIEWHRIPSMRARHFARLLREARVVCGNSSAVVREAPAVGTPSVCIGYRQHGRSEARSVVHVGIPRRTTDLLRGIDAALTKARTPCDDFGDGRAAARFRDVVLCPTFWGHGTDKRWRMAS